MDFNTAEGAQIFGIAVDLALNSGEATAELTADGGAIIRFPGKGGLQAFIDFGPKALERHRAEETARLQSLADQANSMLAASQARLTAAQNVIIDMQSAHATERADHRAEINKLQALLDQANAMMDPAVRVVYKKVEHDAQGMITSITEMHPR